MGDKFTEGIFMGMIDDAERLIAGDPLGETIQPISYLLRGKEPQSPSRTESPLEAVYREAASCHACPEYARRTVFTEPVTKMNPLVLFIAPYPEGPMIFSSPSLEKFRAWWKLSLLLEEGEWALTTLIKCPAASFSAGAADGCRAVLRKEMEIMKPRALVLLGHDTASYMLRKNLPMDELRGQRFVINHIPAFVTYTPSDYLSDPSLQRPIWNDLLFIRRSIGTEGRKS